MKKWNTWVKRDVEKIQEEEQQDDDDDEMQSFESEKNYTIKHFYLCFQR